ncbi:MAG: ATP-binding protein [Salibacteraceae bacterium]
MKLSRKILAKVEELKVIESDLEDLYNDGSISEEVYGNVIVAVTEAFLNAVNHGSNMDETKLIDFVLTLEEKEIEVVIKDSGNGFDLGSLPDPTDPENIEKGSGRGIFIMKNLADEIEFEDKGSKVVMRFKQGKKQAVGA